MLNVTDYEKLAICFRKGKIVLTQTGLIQIFNNNKVNPKGICSNFFNIYEIKYTKMELWNFYSVDGAYTKLSISQVYLREVKFGTAIYLML